MPLGIAAAQLRGSERSMERQHRVALRNELSFMGTGSEVRQFVRRDRLVAVRSSRTLLVKDVSYAYARPQVAMFVRRLAAQYYAKHHEPLVITSLTRPITEQPDNASPLSVHPAGMAVDLRIPDTWEQRRWLETQLLALERRSVLDVTLELHPAHYHVRVFPTDYERYVASLSAVRTRSSAARVTVTKRGPVAARQRQPGARPPIAQRAPRAHRARPLKDARAGRAPKKKSHQSARSATTGANRAARAAG